MMVEANDTIIINLLNVGSIQFLLCQLANQNRRMFHNRGNEGRVQQPQGAEQNEHEAAAAQMNFS